MDNSDLRDNIVDYMRNKCGVQQSVRNRLVAKSREVSQLLAQECVVCNPGQ